jgi:hypothetical protein
MVPAGYRLGSAQIAGTGHFSSSLGLHTFAVARNSPVQTATERDAYLSAEESGVIGRNHKKKREPPADTCSHSLGSRCKGNVNRNQKAEFVG